MEPAATPPAPADDFAFTAPQFYDFAQEGPSPGSAGFSFGRANLNLGTPLSVQAIEDAQINPEVEQALNELQQEAQEAQCMSELRRMEHDAGGGGAGPSTVQTGRGSTHTRPLTVTVLEAEGPGDGGAMEVDEGAPVGGSAAADRENAPGSGPMAPPAVEHAIRKLSFGTMTTGLGPARLLLAASPLPSPPRRSPRPPRNFDDARPLAFTADPHHTPPAKSPVYRAPPAWEDVNMATGGPMPSAEGARGGAGPPAGMTGAAHTPAWAKSAMNGRMRTGAGRVPIAVPLALPLEDAMGAPEPQLPLPAARSRREPPPAAAAVTLVDIPRAHLPFARATQASAAHLGVPVPTARRPVMVQAPPRARTQPPPRPAAATMGGPPPPPPTKGRGVPTRPSTSARANPPGPTRTRAKAPGPIVPPAPSRPTTEEAAFLRARREGEANLRRMRDRNARYRAALEAPPNPGPAAPSRRTMPEEPALATAARAQPRREQREAAALQAQAQASRMHAMMTRSMHLPSGSLAMDEGVPDCPPFVPTVPHSPLLRTATRTRPSAVRPTEEAELEAMQGFRFTARPLDPRVLEGEAPPPLPRAHPTLPLPFEFKTERRAHERSAEGRRREAEGEDEGEEFGDPQGPRSYLVAFGRTVSRLSGEFSLGGGGAPSESVRHRRASVADMADGPPRPRGPARRRRMSVCEASPRPAAGPVFTAGRKRRAEAAEPGDDEGAMLVDLEPAAAPRRSKRRMSMFEGPAGPAAAVPAAEAQEGGAFSLGAAPTVWRLPTSAVKAKRQQGLSIISENVGAAPSPMKRPAVRVREGTGGGREGGALPGREQSQEGRRQAAAELENRLVTLEAQMGGPVSRVPRVRNLR